MAIYKTGPSRHEIAPSLNLDFANTKKLDPRITFTRTSTATYYDGVTHEKAEENLLENSQILNGAWSNNTGVTVSADTVVAPDGTTTAEEIEEATGSASWSIRNSSGNKPAINSSTQYTYSVHAKDVDAQYIAISFRGSAGNIVGATFDLTGASVHNSRAVGTGFSVDSTSITDVGNGWYRCVLTATLGSDVSSNTWYISLSDGSTITNSGFPSYTGSGRSAYFWGAQLEQRSSVTAYTPTTDQPITNYIPALQTAASGEARFDHNPTTGESLGLLIEEQRTNLVTYSSEFNNADWDGTVSITANTIVAPDGTLTGDTADIEGNEFIYQTCSVSASTVYTASWYIKAGTATEHRLAFYDESNLAFIEIFDYNITDGDNVGNGWYRYSRQVTTPVGCTALRVYPLRYGASGHQGTSFLWGAQLEEGSFPTSYIATSGSQVTRNGDSAEMTGDNFSSWYRQDEGTVYVEGAGEVGASSESGGALFNINDGSGENFITLQYGFSDSNDVYFFIRVNDQDQNSIVTIQETKLPNVFYKYAISYSTAVAESALDGEPQGAGGTNLVLPNTDKLFIGKNALSNQRKTRIKKFAYYPARLPNDTLVALTED